MSSTDSGHSEALSYCDGNVYHLTSSILHNAPTTAPLPPRRHSAVQQGSNTSNLYHPQPTMNPNNQQNPENGGRGKFVEKCSMPPPPNPRTRPYPPGTNAGANVAGYNIYTSHQHQLNQMRHAGKYYSDTS
jgi:hypothetical protein